MPTHTSGDHKFSAAAAVGASIENFGFEHLQVLFLDVGLCSAFAQQTEIGLVGPIAVRTLNWTRSNRNCYCYYVAAKATYIRLLLGQNGGFSALAP